MEKPQIPTKPLKEKVIDSYGVHRFRLGEKKVAAVSADSWDNYLSKLREIQKDDDIVVSPELITVAEIPFDQIKPLRHMIRRRTLIVQDVSSSLPNTVFLVGTPTFPQDAKPSNSVIFIQGGKIVGATHNRSAATLEERKYFDQVAEEPPALIPDTDIGVLICADLATASIYGLSDENIDQILRETGRENLVYKNPEFIHPDARRLIVVSCWGIGGIKKPKSVDPDEYYLNQLRAITDRVLRGNKNIDEVLNVDRAPVGSKSQQELASTKPFNALLQRVV